MFEKIIFNVLAFTLFILMFIQLIRKNDTSYLYILVAQFIGITINFIELSIGKSFGIIAKCIMYLLSVILPALIIYIEYKKKIEFAEIFNLLMATIYSKAGKDEEAKKYLSKLIEKYPNSYKGHLLLAQIYEKQEKYEVALDEYERAFEINPTNKNIYLKIGKLYGNVGREDEAIQIFNDLLKKNPEYYEASMILGDILNKKQNYKEAVQVYMNALKYRPADYELYYNLGMTYTLLNDFSKAKECYEKAAQINTLLYHAKYSIGQLNLLYGDLEEAEKQFMECIDVEEVEAGAYYYLARIAMVKGELDKAKNYANIAIEENPEIYNKILEENIFAPIAKQVNKPKITVEKRKGRKKTLSKKERYIDEHLDNTCKLVGKLNNNDIEVIENMRRTQNFRDKDDNQREY